MLWKRLEFLSQRPGRPCGHFHRISEETKLDVVCTLDRSTRSLKIPQDPISQTVGLINFKTSANCLLFGRQSSLGHVANRIRNHAILRNTFDGLGGVQSM